MPPAYRTCPLCEATCGLEIELRADGSIGRIRGDREDVFSRGFICPKGASLKHLHDDPDRLRTPLVRRDGELVEATWDEAFAEVERRLLPIVEAHGRDAVAVYLGNPNVHNLSGLLYTRILLKALGSTSVFTASTVDQRPREIVSGLLYGTMLSHPVPDIDRTDFLLLLGANPYESNGSLATAPDWPGRLAAIRERGGRFVVVDPMRTRTADAASEHVPIRPGTDAFLLLAMVHVLVADGLVDLGHAGPYLTNVDRIGPLAEAFPPEAVAATTGIDAGTIRRLAHELAAAPTAAVYARIGACTQEFGTLASWLVDVLNALTGNLDRPGGVLFSKAAAGALNTQGPERFGRGVTIARRRTRVRGLPESYGELPVAALAEEIETPGDGRIRAMVSIAGNPALSTPNAGRVQAALEQLELLVCVDLYVNETSRAAHVVLPVPSPLTRGHYDLGFYQFAVRNIANYSPPVLPPEDGAMDEWRIFSKLALIAQGRGAGADAALVDDLAVRQLATAAGLDPEEIVDELAPRVGPERLLDLMLRTGPYGLTLDALLEHPHGIDLGPLQPRLPEVLRTPDGMIDLAPDVLVADVERLRAALDDRADAFVLIGRRHVRSNNSWLHNVPTLVKGRSRCTLQVHPDDAQRLALDGMAEVSSRTGTVVADVEVTDAVMPGVVSLPHGWGHDLPGVRLATARAHAGVNSNALADEELLDPVSGNAVLNGIPVQLRPARC